ncbi:BEN domain-containing protein 5 [Armadillidium nasatum]|uniref:BEN domain-containing protein 5 n=1 Tax=Armadillidium nasatum TaxID=96803 RepID=A0A5N5T376_9CRUS|nr:BEN domain-containing protein 5 [Armadillidium nasatum]
MKEKIEKFLTVNASNIKCTRSNDNIIRDIFDGEVYKELLKTGFDPEKDLTFNFSLDGAPLSKSSTMQAWPIFITINEIDLKFRFKNIFTAGFWISVTYKSDKITKISRIFPLFCVADAPAKAKILNFTNHSGYSSCNYCEIHGIYESNAVRFPYGNNAQLRTKKEWQKCARIAMNTNKAVKGIKGSTPLTDLQGFNIIWGAPPDYMHIILLGVMRTLFELYFTNTGNPWYIGSPKQQNILPEEYYNHILHLRAGLMLLLKRAVAKDDVIKANEHFHNFVCYFEILFGVQYSTFNIHMLLHLSQSVKKCGPLWGYSAFPFENNLRIFRTLITGTKIPTKQVVKKVKVIQFLNMISHENINKEVLKFCEINYNVGYSISKLDRPLKVGKPLEISFPWDNYTESEALAIQSLNIANKIILYGNIKFSHFTVDTKNNNTLFLVNGKEDDEANLEKYERSIYEGTILDLGASKESFSKQKRIASVPVTMLESPSETELDDHSSKILSMGNALPQAKTIDLLQTMKKNLTQNSKIRSDSEDSSSDEEVYIRKRKVDEYENKIFNQKKKIKTLQNENEVLKSKFASLETDFNTLKEKLNRDGSNAGIGEMFMYRNAQEPSSGNKNKEKEIIFGSISFPEKPFLTISRRPKNSLFVKDLVSLLWSDEDLSQRSLTGKKHYNSKEIKQPLTPEKRFAIEEAFKDRLKKQQHHDATIALELKLVNRYIAEKINDVRKCNSRRNLNMTYDIQNKNIPREEEKDFSENEPTSKDMIN